MKHINLDLIRVTEAGAIAASQWVGSGNKEEADRAATEAMRDRFNKIEFAGKVVICEGEKDNSYYFKSGEYLGTYGQFGGKTPSAGSAADLEVDIAPNPHVYSLCIDPIEGTTPTVTSGPEALSTIAIARENAMYQPSTFYMKKLACGPHIKAKVPLNLDDPIERTLELVSFATGKKLHNITVCILNRPRHASIIKTLRDMGVRIKLIQDCDVSGAIATCLPESGVDLLYGIGGSPEAVISACAIKCMGGDFQARECIGDNKEDMSNWTIGQYPLSMEDLVKGECAFVATGITNGSILKGVRWGSHGPITNSVFMRSESGTIRWLECEHGN